MAKRRASQLIHLDSERIRRRGDKPMTGAETLDELVFLLDAGVHPLLAADQLGHSWANLIALAGRHDRSAEINRVDLHEWRRYRTGRAA